MKKTLQFITIMIVSFVSVSGVLAKSSAKPSHKHSKSVAKHVDWRKVEIRRAVPVNSVKNTHLARALLTGPWNRFVQKEARITNYRYGKRRIVHGRRLGGADFWSRQGLASTGIRLREPSDASAGVAAASCWKDEIPYGSLIIPLIEKGRYAYINADCGEAVTIHKALRTIYSYSLKVFKKRGRVVIQRIKRKSLRPLHLGDATVDLARNSPQGWPDGRLPVIIAKYQGPRPFIKLSLSEKEALMRQAPRAARMILASIGKLGSNVATR